MFYFFFLQILPWDLTKNFLFSDTSLMTFIMKAGIKQKSQVQRKKTHLVSNKYVLLSAEDSQRKAFKVWGQAGTQVISLSGAVDIKLLSLHFQAASYVGLHQQIMHHTYLPLNKKYLCPGVIQLRNYWAVCLPAENRMTWTHFFKPYVTKRNSTTFTDHN